MWELGHKEDWVPKNWCFWTEVLEESLERCLRVPWTARRSNQSILKEINPNIHWKEWWWSWSSSTLATWWEELFHWKRPWCWERLRAREQKEKATEDEMVGWNLWLNGHWVWANSGREWRTGKPGMLQFMGSQRIGPDLVTEQQQHQRVNNDYFSSNATASSRRQEDGFNDLPLLETLPRLLNFLRTKWHPYVWLLLLSRFGRVWLCATP